MLHLFHSPPQQTTLLTPRQFEDVERSPPRLRHFGVPGLYIRPSLPKSERDRLRAERAARRGNADPMRSVLLSPLKQLVRGNTLGNHILDLVLCNDVSVVSNLKVRPPIGTSDHARKSAAWDRAVATGKPQDWDRYRSLRDRYNKRVWKFNNNIEKRVEVQANIPKLVTADGSAAITDDAKVEVLADVFMQSFESGFQSDSSSPGAASAQFPIMADSVWFAAAEIYELLIRWPLSYST
ncbi:hypothetical protein OSTOST_07925, partial [Ostertagia ostertagi]